MNAIVEHENAPLLPTLQSGGAVKAIVPQDFDGAWRIANAVVKAGMAPRGLDSPEKAMVAIMHGLEVGLTPMNALQSIAVINSRATLWGDGALGLVQASGKMSSFEEWSKGEGDNRKAFCKVVRRGDEKPKLGEFSVSDAKKAGLWGKQGPWTQYPDRMLKMRARAFALRDGFSDVLRGLGIAEEVQDTPIRDITPPKPPEPPAPPRQEEPEPPIEDTSQDAEIIEPAEEASDADIDDNTFFEQMEGTISCCLDAASVEEAWTEFDPEGRFDGDDINLGIATAIKNRRLKQIEKSNG